MPAIDAEDKRKVEFSSLKMRSVRPVLNLPRATFFVSIILGLGLLLTSSLGCGPSTPGNGGQGPSGASDRPELTDDVILERINETGVREVPEVNGAAEPISWSFDQDEPKEVTVVEKQTDGVRATLVLDIKTTSGPRSRTPRYLAGQIRTEWKLETGWVLRRWEIIATENISMKYKNLPKPPAENANR